MFLNIARFIIIIIFEIRTIEGSMLGLGGVQAGVDSAGH
jgi:hypothetical protein